MLHKLFLSFELLLSFALILLTILVVAMQFGLRYVFLLD